MRKIAILGTTGSIGTQTLSIVEEKKDLDVVAMSCGSNIDLFEKQIRKFSPKLVSCGSEDKANALRERIADLNIEVLSGMDGLVAVATHSEAEIVVTAIVGMLGIRPTVAAINAGKDIALANKETLVTAGHIIMPLSKEKNISILPVDSEHSAIFQSLQGNEGNKIHKILLTASGGPFRGFTSKQLQDVTLEDALKHPNWDMGNKITIDSATLMNKGLEFIEAKWLFDLAPDQIEIVVHRQSVVHSAVEYNDYSVIAQLGVPDMKIPIQYALLYPDRMSCPTGRLSLTDYGKLTFEKPDYDTFKCLSAAIEAIKRGGAYPCLVNSANEEAVKAFLHDETEFIDIGETVSSVLEHFAPSEINSYEDVMKADKAARAYVRERIAAK